MSTNEDFILDQFLDEISPNEQEPLRALLELPNQHNAVTLEMQIKFGNRLNSVMAKLRALALSRTGLNYEEIRSKLLRKIEERFNLVQGPFSLNEYFERREASAEALDEELSIIGERLKSYIPDSLKEFAAEYFYDIDVWLQNLYMWSNNEYGRIDNKIKYDDLEGYGFDSFEDAYVKLQKLKEAWAGIIDVDLKPEKTQLVVKFTITKNPATTKKASIAKQAHEHSEAEIRDAVQFCINQPGFGEAIREMGITIDTVMKSLREAMLDPKEARSPNEVAISLANNLIDIKRNPSVQEAVLKTLINS